jgi:hypothetical protein
MVIQNYKDMKKSLSIVMLAALITSSSCSKNDEQIIDNSDTLSEVMQPFQEKIELIDIPQTLKDNSNVDALTVTNQFNTIKNYGAIFSNYLIVPDNASTSNSSAKNTAVNASKTFIWSEGGVSITYTITELADRYTFLYSINSTEYSGEILSGYILKDETYAAFTLKNDQDGNVYLTSKWWFENSSVKTEIVNNQNFKYKLDANLDNKSGEIELFDNTNLLVKYLWDENGDGSITTYTTGSPITSSW